MSDDVCIIPNCLLWQLVAYCEVYMMSVAVYSRTSWHSYKHCIAWVQFIHRD